MACREDQFRCNDGVCLNINQRCNFIQECVTGEDEKGCSKCCLRKSCSDLYLQGVIIITCYVLSHKCIETYFYVLGQNVFFCDTELY
jgi:hypothetical protein